MITSNRKQRFLRLVEAAYAQTTDWLVGAMRSPGMMNRLSRTACLHVIAQRLPSSLPYPKRKHEARRVYGF